MVPNFPISCAFAAFVQPRRAALVLAIRPRGADLTARHEQAETSGAATAPSQQDHLRRS